MVLSQTLIVVFHERVGLPHLSNIMQGGREKKKGHKNLVPRDTNYLPEARENHTAFLYSFNVFPIYLSQRCRTNLQEFTAHLILNACKGSEFRSY